MARGRSKSSPGAHPSRIARRSLPSYSYPGPFPSLALTQDNRTWHPAGPFRAPLSLHGTTRPRLAAARSQRYGKAPKLHHITFEAPQKVLICVRRRRRKEVLFAKKKTGKGSRFNRKPRRNYWSSISCKG